MPVKLAHKLPVALVLVAALCAAAVSVLAQGGVAGAPQAPAAGAPPAGGQGAGAAADPAAGRGRIAGAATPDFSPKPPVLPLTPAEEAKRFWLQPGFKMEPVLADPDIKEPASIAFDGNGRMYVLELRGYMQDSDGGGTLNPVGRVSWHEDRNNDGIYETHGVFIDNMIFPRTVMPIGINSVLSKESNADELYRYTDTNGDGVADKKELFATGMGRLANVEHQEGHFNWTMDNWIYSTVNTVRLRWTPTGVLREPIGSGGAQWGVTQDNYGKQWFQSGASGMPGYFQFPIVYGNFANPDQFEPNLNITWGAPVLIADMQGGMNSVRMPDGSLSRATGSAGNDIFRGDRLPADMVGDYFYGEVVARIVRRFHPVKTEGLTQVRNVYPLSEFLRSTDPLFRPVDQTTAPDGTMYITDMYHGIIQESQWSGPGTYLRQRIDQYALDKVIGKGRIWRLSYDSMPRRTDQPRMGSETAAQLVGHLTDPNGWWRDTAQQLLVLKQDKSVVPQLKDMARTSSNQLARIHALWTLEGLGSADAPLLRELMASPDPQIRQQAIRVSETLYKAGDRTLANDYKNLTKDADVDVVLQAMMTMNTLKVADAATVIKATQDANKARGVQIVATSMLGGGGGGGRGGIGGGRGGGGAALTPVETAAMAKGEGVYKELCFACHGDDGRGGAKDGSPQPMAPPLAGSTRVLGHRDYVAKVLLHGLTGPLAGNTYSEVMIPMKQQNDEWIAAVGSYIRNSFGNRAGFITAADVARVRAATRTRTTAWTSEAVEATLPKQVVLDPNWKFTASHNPSIASYAVTIQPWHSSVSQAPGMWLQVELPQPVMLTELQFEAAQASPTSAPIVAGAPPRTGGGPIGAAPAARGGGGGRGAAPAAGTPGAAPAGGAPGAAPGAAAEPAAAAGGRGGAAAAPAAPPAPTSFGYPRGYKVEVSVDGTNWGAAPVATGAGTGAQMTIAFAPVRAKFVRITQTAPTAGADTPPFTVQRLRLYEAPAAPTPAR